MPELVVYGIILGSIIALGAIGLTLIYGILRFANFAHGDLMPFIRWNFCEPVNQKSPACLRWSTAILIAVNNSGAYCTSSIITGGGYC